jgi:hypothetical protein
MGKAMIENPPPVLGNARVLEYAVLDNSVTYTGRGPLFVGTRNDGLKELGPVPCLAIAEDFETGDILLLHCDEGWDVLGVAGGYGSLAEAKARAERAYDGLASCWIDPKIAREQAQKFRDDMWANQRCSFCDRIPPEVSQMIERNNVRICDVCVADFQKTSEP